MLDKEDYQKINLLLTDMHCGYFPDNDSMDYRRNILELLNNLYNYNKSSFLIFENFNFDFNDLGLILNNVSLNLNENVYKDYYDYFYKIDVSNPLTFTPEQKLRLENKPVIALTDIMSSEEYEATEFYRKFMKRYNLYYFMIVSFIINNKRLGLLGVYRSKDEGPFREKDIEIINEIKEPIAHGLYTHIKINELLFERQSFINYTENFPLGIVLLDKNYNYIRSNSTAEQYFSNLGTKNINFFKEYFVAKILPKIHVKLYNQGTNQEIPLSVTVDNYMFRIVKFDMPGHSGIENFYNVYIMKMPNVPNSKIHMLMKEKNLSLREMEITELIVKGYKNEDIAEELFLSIYTIKTHIQNIYKKIGVSNRSMLIYKLNNL